MSRFGYVVVTTLAAEIFAVLFLGVAWLAPHPRLIWNASASAPIGLYRLHQTDAPKVGEMVAIMPPPALAHFMAERRYLPIGLPLLKHIAALPGTQVCRHGAVVTIGGKPAAIARRADSHGRALPVWRGCHTLRAGEVFLLNPAADSMDGRYSGAIPVVGLLGRATPLLTRKTPQAPLVWQGEVR